MMNKLLLLLAAVATFVWGSGSLLLVAIKTNSVKSVFLKKPSIIIGDFFILPIISVFIVGTFDGQLTGIISGQITFWAALFSFIATAISAFRNQLISLWWLPHLLFYWFFGFLFLSFLARKFDLDSVVWWLVLSGILTHQLLGVIFPKKFPKI